MTYGSLVQFHINMKLSPVNSKGPIARREIIEAIHCHNWSKWTNWAKWGSCRNCL